MKELNIEKERWPCPISNHSKEQLARIAQSGNGCTNLLKTSGICYIKKGLAILYYASGQMNNTLGYVIGSGDWIGASTLLNKEELFLLSAELEPVEFLFFSTQKILHLAETEPEMYKLLYYCMVHMQPVYLQSQLTSLHDKEVRVAYMLLFLAQKKQTIKGAKIIITITQEQLCLATGISRPRINEVLKKFEKHREIVIERGKIYILDIVALGHRLDYANTMFYDPRTKKTPLIPYSHITKPADNAKKHINRSIQQH
ncbi:Crp/Fnr family transcriptional regulator [Psychromonas sp.]|uniref:Crp/Fnr family transcriptional regulator n=1 Tax=Psychromonas sp. TaxID=1884585 RepID=UPI0035681F8D